MKIRIDRQLIGAEAGRQLALDGSVISVAAASGRAAQVGKALPSDKWFKPKPKPKSKPEFEHGHEAGLRHSRVAAASSSLHGGMLH